MRFGDLGILADAVGQALDDFFRKDFRAGTAGGGSGKSGLRKSIHNGGLANCDLFTERYL
jgi:hypothetical protein